MIPYIGGKSRLAQWIMSQFPPHVCYVEVFGGSAAVLLDKSPSQVEVYNDIDKDLINLFRIVRDPAKCRELFKRGKWLLFSRAEFLTMREKWRTADYTDEIDHALAFAYYMCVGRCGKRSGMSYSMNKSAHATASSVWFNFMRRLVDTRKRLEKVNIECLDYSALFAKYDSKDTLFYCDPPYLKSDFYYCVNWKEEDHIKLAFALHTLKGRFILSYYDSDFIRSLYPDCYFLTKEVPIYVHQQGGGKTKAVELLVTNFTPPSELSIETFMEAYS